MHGLFITGTNTGVGKTWLTARIATELRRQGVRVGAYKPVCSGAETDANGITLWPDIEALHAALDGEFPRDWIGPQRFAAPLAPPSAARLEGGSVDATKLRSGVDVWREAVDVLLVEGVGGWLCPVAEGETIADLAADLRFPVLIAAALELGTINHTLLTAESVLSRGLPVAGIVLNEVHNDLDETLRAETIDAICSFAPVPILGGYRCGGAFYSVGDTPAEGIDWKELANDQAPMTKSKTVGC